MIDVCQTFSMNCRSPDEFISTSTPDVDKCRSRRHRIQLLCLIHLLRLTHSLRLTPIRSHHQFPFAARHRHSLSPIVPIQGEENAIMNEAEPLRGGIKIDPGPHCIRPTFARHCGLILLEADEPPVPL